LSELDVEEPRRGDQNRIFADALIDDFLQRRADDEQAFEGNGPKQQCEEQDQCRRSRRAARQQARSRDQRNKRAQIG